MTRALALAALLAACRPAGDPGRLVVLGMDGLEPTRVEAMAARGELPNFRRLLDEGARGRIAVEPPILSPIIWTSYASGYPAAVHGIGGWTHADGGAYTAADVRVARLWDAATAAGAGSLVLGWLMSWPASPIEGAVLSDRFVFAFPMNKDPADPSVAISRAAHADTWGLAWPPELAERARAWVPAAEDFADTPIAYQLAAYGAPFHPATRDEAQVRAFEALWPESGARLALVYCATADQVSHLYWPFADPDVRRLRRKDPLARAEAAAEDAARPGRRAYPYAEGPVTAEQIEEAARWVPDAYRFLDGLLGRVIAAVDPATTTLIVLSDHGFQSSPARPVLNGGHRPEAALYAWGARARAGAEVEATVADIGPTLYALAGLPAAADMPGRVLDGLVSPPPTPPPVPSRVLDAAPAPLGGGAGGDEPGAAALLEQLEALGYVDDRGAPVLGASRHAGGR